MNVLQMMLGTIVKVLRWGSVSATMLAALSFLVGAVPQQSSGLTLDAGHSPSFVNIDVGSFEAIMTLSARDHRALAADAAARAVVMASNSPSSPVALRITGAPRMAGLLSDEQRGRLRATHAGNAIDAAYDGAMLALLARVHEDVSDALPNHAIGIYGLPVEDSGIWTRRIRESNQRLSTVLDGCNILISSHAIVASGSNRTVEQIIGSGLSEGLKVRGDRPMHFRFNGSWSVLGGRGGLSALAINDEIVRSRTVIDQEHVEELIDAGSNDGLSAVDPTEVKSPEEGGGSGGTITPFVPDLRPGLLIPCAGATITLDNPLGLREGQHLSLTNARNFYRRHYQRAEQLGVERVIWHMPAGYDEQGMAGRAAVLTVMGARGNVFLQEAAAFKARNPNASVGVYISSKVPQTIHSSESDDILPWEIYDHENERHRGAMIEGIIRPLAEAGFQEVWFDNGSLPSGRPDMYKLCDEIRAQFGMHTIIEAYPRAGGELDQEDMLRAGSGATHRFNVIANELRGFDPWVAPEGSEMLLILSRHPVEGALHRSLPRMTDVVNYMERGMIIFSMDPQLDDLLAPAIDQWQNSQPQTQ